jgi:hypothetical protein
MKNFLVALFLLAASGYSYGQLNPVANLTWFHGYEYPENFYNLQWNAPQVAPGDTLAGYNVYRNNVLWRFQADTALYCMPFFCPDPDFLLMEEFWIKVTAVYNQNHVESAATDSILDHGIAIGVKEKGRETFEILTNPIKPGETIRLRWNTPATGGKILLLNSLGIVCAECILPGGLSAFDWNAGNLRKGVYYLAADPGKPCTVKKVIVQ